MFGNARTRNQLDLFKRFATVDYINNVTHRHAHGPQHELDRYHARLKHLVAGLLRTLLHECPSMLLHFA